MLYAQRTGNVSHTHDATANNDKGVEVGMKESQRSVILIVASSHVIQLIIQHDNTVIRSKI